MRRSLILFGIIVSIMVGFGCGSSNDQQKKLALQKEMTQLIQEQKFEAARIAAIDTLDPDIKALYYEADDNLGHASHLDVRCNERIEDILYDIVKKIPAKDIKLNRYVYSKLVSIYPEHKLYKKKFINYDRKYRAGKKPRL